MEKPEVESGAGLFEASLFDGGLNGWEFKYWMPQGRQIRHELKGGVGHLGGPGLEVYADGRDDDGIFFLQKCFPAAGLSGAAFLSWSFARFDPRVPIGAWPRVAYVGPPKELDNPESQHDFTWLEGSDRLVALVGPGEWNTQHYAARFKGTGKLQVCVGWKINWETERLSYIDRVVIAAV